MTGNGNQAGRFRRPGAALTLLAFAQLIISLDYNIVYVALPEIGSALGFSAQTLQWVVSAYAVAFGGFLLSGGRAVDLLGPRRMFVLGLVVYAVSSLAGGLATATLPLVAARAAQGLGGALLFPATLTLVSTGFAEGRARNRAFAVWGTAGGSGMILGSLLGGVLTGAFGWSAVFFVNVPLAGAAALLALPLVPRGGAQRSGRRFDLAGALTVTAGTTLMVFALVQGPEYGWTALSVLGAAVAGVLLLTAFAVIESRGTDPLLPLRLLRRRDLGTGALVTFLYMATFGTLLYFLTSYFQLVHGYDALRTGLAFLVPMAAIVAGSQLAGRLATARGTRTAMIAGLVVGGLGTLVVGLSLSTGGSYLALLPGLMVLGIGQGAGYTLMFGAATAGTAAHQQGVASAVASTAQQIGGAVGLAILVTIASASTNGMTGSALRAATADGLRAAFFVAAAGIALTALVALGFTPARRPRIPA
ncbi:MFS transporter [Actinopolymorpha pittospori]|uniref:EmrB/QacA subfamily drug resistance transporter n=1 Tax=Actinopolymorpha pittospori TaxID=648752 RepID=A0A927MQ21_9ACTN|nr:MFS transporter [Actinopolymorpha pittospori]MBE1604271.1 EmrB/QacA subfamily drug resistance transporter [Actinopolymorpha pittospori]